MNCFGGCNSWIIILILIVLFCNDDFRGNNCGCNGSFNGRGCGCGGGAQLDNPNFWGETPPPVIKGAAVVFLGRPWLLRSAKRTRLRNNRWRIAK